MCRVCFKSPRETELSEVTQDLISVIQTCLGIQLQTVEDSKICQKCKNILVDIKEFKLMLMQQETRIFLLLTGRAENEKPLVLVPPNQEIVEEIEEEESLEEEYIVEVLEENFLEANSDTDTASEVENEVQPTQDFSGQPFVSCPICQKKFIGKNLVVHMLQHKSKADVTEEEKLNYADRYCNVCEVFVTKSMAFHNFTYHGTGVKPQSAVEKLDSECLCDLCGRVFVRFSTLRNHIENVHMKIRNVSCSICQRQFYNKVHLDAHVKTKHQKPQHECSYCDKNFTSNYALNLHIESIHLKRGAVKCPQCEAVFNNKGALSAHLKTTHSDTPRKFANVSGKCVCGYAFNSRVSLSQHLDHHKGKDGRFYCPCSRSYDSKFIMRRHLEQKHGIKCLRKRQEIE